jgi:heat shock protein HslJ
MTFRTDGPVTVGDPSRVSFQKPGPLTVADSSQVSFQKPGPLTTDPSRVSFQKPGPLTIDSSRVSFQKPGPLTVVDSNQADPDALDCLTEPQSQTPSLVSEVWEWERFVGGDGTLIRVQDPSRYTLILNPDGTYQVSADCNRVRGAYSLDQGHLNLLPGPTTLAECGPDSLYSEFLVKLGNVRSFVYDDEGRLVLNLWADGGSLVFHRAVNAE